jgi:hypothetical protein
VLEAFDIFANSFIFIRMPVLVIWLERLASFIA